MGKTVKVTGPASREEVDTAYRESTDRRERERLLAIRLGQQGRWTLQQIAEVVRRGRATIGRWVRAYRQGGLPGLLERHYEGERRPPSLGPAEREELKQGLAKGRWKTAREIQAWLKHEREKELKLGAIYYWLGQGRASWKVPRKSHKKKTRSKKQPSKLRWSPS